MTSFTGSGSSRSSKTHKAELSLVSLLPLFSNDLLEDHWEKEEEEASHKVRQGPVFNIVLIFHIPTRFCHICSCPSKNVRLVVCSKIKLDTCHKVVCKNCLEGYELGDFDLAADTPIARGRVLTVHIRTLRMLSVPHMIKDQ